MTKKNKPVFISCTVVVGACLLLFGYSFVKAVRQFGLEERIAIAFYAIEEAVNQYRDEHGSLPGDLAVLVPKYVRTLPELPAVRRIEYVPSRSGESCAIRMHEHGDGEHFVYVKVLGREFNLEERGKRIREFHFVWVFRER